MDVSSLLQSALVDAAQRANLEVLNLLLRGYSLSQISIECHPDKYVIVVRDSRPT